MNIMIYILEFFTISFSYLVLFGQENTMRNALTITTLFRAIELSSPIEVTVYVTCPRRGVIETRRALRVFTTDTSGVLWAKGITGPTWSLRDAGIIPNNYNEYKSFLCRRDAEAYSKSSCTCQCACCLDRNSRQFLDIAAALKAETRWSKGSWGFNITSFEG